MSFIDVSSVPPDSIAECNILHSIAVPQSLLEQGCRIILPSKYHRQIATKSVNKVKEVMPQMEVSAIMQYSDGPVSFRITDANRENCICSLYPNLNNGLIVLSHSDESIHFMSSPDIGDMQSTVDPHKTSTLEIGTWMVFVGTCLTPTVIIRVLDVSARPQMGQELAGKSEVFNFNQNAAYQPFTYTYDRHIAGHNWKNPTNKPASNIVYQGTHSKKDVVVIKTLLKPNMNPPDHIYQAKLYGREIKIHSRLSHESILPIHGSDARCLTIFLEYVPGQDLVHSFPTLTPANVITIWRSILNALAYVHSQNLAHNDIKPDNILWDGEKALLCDFGMTAELPVESGGGTPWYLSPEYWAGTGKRDASADIWAFGVTVSWLRKHIPFPPNSRSDIVLPCCYHLTW